MQDKEFMSRHLKLCHNIYKKKLAKLCCDISKVCHDITQEKRPRMVLQHFLHYRDNYEEKA